MLVDLCRVLFPEVAWITAKHAREWLGRRRALREGAQHSEGDY